MMIKTFLMQTVSGVENKNTQLYGYVRCWSDYWSDKTGTSLQPGADPIKLRFPIFAIKLECF